MSKLHVFFGLLSCPWVLLNAQEVAVTQVTVQKKVAPQKKSDDKSEQAMEALEKGATYLKGQFHKVFKEADYTNQTLEIAIGEFKYPGGIPVFVGAGVRYNFGFSAAGELSESLPTLMFKYKKDPKTGQLSLESSGAEPMGQYLLAANTLRSAGLLDIASFFEKAQNLKPDQVFLMRVVTLLVSVIKNRDSKAFPTSVHFKEELGKLWVRLSNTINPDTEKPYTIEDVLKNAPAPVINFLKQVYIKGMPIYQFLVKFDEVYKRARVHKFMGDVGYDPDSEKFKLSSLQTAERLMAILLRVFVGRSLVERVVDGKRTKVLQSEFTKAREFYFNTAEGKAQREATLGASTRFSEATTSQTRRAALETLIKSEKELNMQALKHPFPRLVIAKTRQAYVKALDTYPKYFTRKIVEKKIGEKTIWVLNESLQDFASRELVRTAIFSEAYEKHKIGFSNLALMLGIDFQTLEREIVGRKAIEAPKQEPKPDAPTLEALEVGLIESGTGEELF